MITASALERVLACPGSLALPHVSSTSPAADRGTAGHAFLAAAGKLGREAALEAVPEEHRPLCEAIDLDRLPVNLLTEATYAWSPATGAARFLGVDLGRDYSGVQPGEMAGTADVVGVDPEGRRALVADYKLGFTDVTPAARNPQLTFLALCVSLVYGLDEVHVEIIRIRPDGTPWRDRAALDVLELAAFAARLRLLPDRVELAKTMVASGWPPSVAEGPHCRWCPAFAACPAKGRLAVQVAEGRLLDGPEALLPLTPERAGLAWDRLKAARQLLAHVERAVMATLEEAGGVLPLPGGRQLVKRQAPGNEALVGAVAFQVLAELHGVDVAAKAVEMKATKSGIRDALRPIATKHGELGRAEKAVLEEVRKRDGATRGVRTVVEEVEAPAP